MTLSVNTLKDKWHRYFSNQILLLHYPAYDFSHNYFCLPIWDSSSSFMRLDLSFTEGFLLWKLHSFLHIFHFLLSATFSFNRWHLKKKKKKGGKEKFPLAPLLPLATIFFSSHIENKTSWKESSGPFLKFLNNIHIFLLGDTVFINFLAFKKT